MSKFSFIGTIIFGNAYILIEGIFIIPFTAMNVFLVNYSPESNIQVMLTSFYF